MKENASGCFFLNTVYRLTYNYIHLHSSVSDSEKEKETITTNTTQGTRYHVNRWTYPIMQCKNVLLHVKYFASNAVVTKSICKHSVLRIRMGILSELQPFSTVCCF